MMGKKQEQQLMDKLTSRENKLFVLTTGDQIRLENQIFTVTDKGEFKASTEDHTADIPFYGELYKDGIRTWEPRTFLKENDRFAVDDDIYKITDASPDDWSMHHVLVKETK